MKRLDQKKKKKIMEPEVAANLSQFEEKLTELEGILGPLLAPGKLEAHVPALEFFFFFFFF